ncbi:MAG: hypothetical protein RL499_123, partial [Actinomycetota bacterium]
IESRANGRIKRGFCSTQLLGRYPHRGWSHAIEAFGLVKERRAATVANIRNEGVDGVDGGAHVARGTRYEGQQVCGRQGAAAQIESSHHDAFSLIAARLGNTRAWMRLHRP